MKIENALRVRWAHWRMRMMSSGYTGKPFATAVQDVLGVTVEIADAL